MAENIVCPDEETIRLFADDKLDSDSTERIRPHFDACDSCRETLAKIDTRYSATQLTEDFVPKDDEKFDASILAPPTREGSVGRLADYEIMRVIGAGGMGVVLEGYDDNLQRAVAIKVLARQIATSEKSRQRFTREARAVAAVRHSNIVTIHAVDEHDGIPFIVMEFVRGKTLHDKIVEGGSLKPSDALRIGHQIASGLAAAHAEGVIHRDIKPANILLEADTERVKITDFGLARVAVENTELTSLGETVGTPAFMSPEQITGEELDHKTDLFSLGVVMYAMLSGRSPFHGANLYKVIRKVCDTEPEPLEKITECPQLLSNVVKRLLAKNPADRFESAEEVAMVLDAQQASGAEASSDKVQSLLSMSGIQPIPQRSRNKKPLAIGIGILVVAVAAIVFALLNGEQNDVVVNEDNKQQNTSESDAAGDESKESISNPSDVDGTSSQRKKKSKVAFNFAQERKAAEWVLEVDGIIKIKEINGGSREVIDKADLPNANFVVTEINLSQSLEFSDDALAVLSGLSRLVHLQLSDTGVSDAALTYLADLKTLDYVGLKAANITDAGLVHLSKLPVLTRLNLMNTSVTDSCFEHLQNVTTLSRLYLTDTQLGDDVIQYFKKFRNLQIIEMVNTNLGEEGVRQLAEHRGLTALYLSGTAISDAGLQYFKSMKSLRTLHIERIDFSAEKITELRQELRKCDIRHTVSAAQ